MSTFTYIVYHTDMYQTSHSYAESLMLLANEQILLEGMLHNDSNELAVQFTSFVVQVKNQITN